MTRNVRTSLQHQKPNALAELLNQVAVHEGHHVSAIKGVWITRASAPRRRHAVVYEPSIAIVAQGQKRGFLGDQVYRYDAQNYLVLSVPLPFECEFDASQEEPLLVLSIEVTPALVSEVLLEMDDSTPLQVAVPRGIYSSPLEPELTDGVIRLLKCLRSPQEARVLGRQMVREVVYRVLCGPQGSALRALAYRDESFTRIARVLKVIHTDYSEALTIEELARRAGMSVSMFHQNFKLVTASSPLQYLKRIRLHKAKALMAYDGYNASTAASRVGYESASQFSREFRRLFGASPVEEARKFRRTTSDMALRAE